MPTSENDSAGQGKKDGNTFEEITHGYVSLSLQFVWALSRIQTGSLPARPAFGPEQRRTASEADQSSFFSRRKVETRSA
ncbi:hypothetical protein ACC771_01570, partial [Rhizobium ruizarguesonis]